MKTVITALLLSLAVTSATAFAPISPNTQDHRFNTAAVVGLSAEAAAAEGVPLANGKMSFNRVCREWRCKYEGDKGTSKSLEVGYTFVLCVDIVFVDCLHNEFF